MPEVMLSFGVVTALVVGGLATFIWFKNQKPTQAAGVPTEPVKGEACIELVRVNENSSGNPVGPLGDESLADVRDFGPFSSTRPVSDPLAILKDPNSSVYTYDQATQSVVVVMQQSTDEVEDSTATFVYQEQRTNARRVFLFGVTSFINTMKQLSEGQEDQLLEKVLVVHSTGRCGSTLLSKALGAAHLVRSLAEPDIYSAITLAMNHKNDKLDKDVGASILRFATVHLARRITITSSAVIPNTANMETVVAEANIVAIKTRSWVMSIAHELAAALPESKTIFLYRDPMAVVDSFCAAFLNNPVTKFLRAWNLDTHLIMKAGWMQEFIDAVAPIYKEPRFQVDALDQLGVVGNIAMLWISGMEQAYECLTDGTFDCSLRYKELVDYKEDMLNELFDQLYPGKFPTKLARGQLSDVFSKDAHGDASTASARIDHKTGVVAKETVFLRAKDAPLIGQLLSQCKPEILEAEFQLPLSLLTDLIEIGK
eukprot:m.9630 g.9630  ORF g.9630 m.9630 type:complete len:484 (-) comp5476_c1_seq1:80-1531(-)